jgi:hypothetical protein
MQGRNHIRRALSPASNFNSLLNFRRRAGEMGWKQTVEERDQGTFD